MSVKELKAAVNAVPALKSAVVGFSEKREYVDLLVNHYGGPCAK
jgi:hypothetical protein